MLMETREKKVTSMKLGPDGGLSVGLRGSRETCCAARAGIQVMRIKVVVVIEKREGSTAGQFLDPLTWMSWWDIGQEHFAVGASAYTGGEGSQREETAWPARVWSKEWPLGQDSCISKGLCPIPSEKRRSGKHRWQYAWSTSPCF